MPRPIRVPRLLPAIAVTLALLAACGTPTVSPSPSASPSPNPTPGSVEPTVPAPTATASVPAAGALDPSLLTACLGLDERDCERALEAAATLLPPGSPVVYAEVGPFGCATGVECQPTLDDRPTGQVTFELGQGDPMAVRVSLVGAGNLALEPGEVFMIGLPPSSARVQLGGPVPYTLGHCGLWSGVDVDGSWWDPVGPVDFDHGDAINAASGTFVPSDPNHAVFTSEGGLVVSLVRRLGDKHLPLCQ